MSSSKTITAIALAVTLSILAVSVFSEDSDADDAADITEIDFHVPITRIIIAGDLPDLADEGDVALVDGFVYQWIDASLFFRPVIAVDDPANQFVVDYMTVWYRAGFKDPYYGTTLRHNNISGDQKNFSANGNNDTWMFTSMKLYIHSGGWDASDILSSTTFDAPPLGVATLNANPGPATYDVEILSWESVEFGESGWVLMGEFPLSGAGDGPWYNNIVSVLGHDLPLWQAIIIILVAIILICGIVGWIFKED